MPLELRRWFQVLLGLVSLALTATCCSLVHAALPASGNTAAGGLALLTMAATMGFYQLLMLAVPVLLLKLWPALEG